jgi:hypothetical protein
MWLGHPVPGCPWSVPLHVLRSQRRSRFFVFCFNVFYLLPDIDSLGGESF